MSQFVLRGFECPIKAKHLVHLDTRSGRSRPVPIKSVGWTDHLYGASDDGGQYDNRIEAFLALVEGYAAPALARLIEGRVTLTEDDSMPVSLFLGLQLSRTPRVLEGIGSLVERMGQAELMRTLEDPEAFAHVLSQSRGQRLQPQDVERERSEYRKAFADGTVTLCLAPKRSVGLEAMVTSFIEGGMAMAHADWWILHPEIGSAFVLNDSGYARFDESDGLPISRGIAFPMRPDACIVVAPPTSDVTQVRRAQCSSSHVAWINLRTYGWSSRFIFGHSQAAVTTVHAAARRSKRRSRPPSEREMLPGPP